MVDGNFTAQHMKMRKPEDDIPLSDGLAYMVANEPYQNHIKQAANNEEVCVSGPWEAWFTSLCFFQRSTCQNYRAVNDANTNKTHLRATGVGATACARHGCFVPHSVVDFYKGEQ